MTHICEIRSTGGLQPRVDYVATDRFLAKKGCELEAADAGEGAAPTIRTS